MHMIFMGTGTSHGIPVIGCSCPVCCSHDKKDKRLRCSVYITNRGEKEASIQPVDIVVDTGPEFRIQALRCKIKRLDSVLLTHSHADHMHGLDDLRIFSFVKPMSSDCTKSNQNSSMVPLSVYANSNTIDDLKYRFSYAFRPIKEGGGKPNLHLVDCAQFIPGNSLKIGSVSILPIPIMHGHLKDSGWLFSQIQSDGKKHSIAYLTDCSFIPDESIKLLLEQSGILDHLVIDGLRKKPHSTHFSFDEALACAEKIGAKHTWLTHICHDSKHKEIIKYINTVLPKYIVLNSIVSQGGSVLPAWDGLVLK